MNQFPIMLMMVVAAGLGALGQWALNLASDSFGISLKGTVMNGYLWLFALTYGIAVLINILAYKFGGKLSVIYPVIALSYIFTAFIAWKFMGEQMNAWIWSGTMVIIFGVGMIGWGASV